ncbi:hypothetical protein KCU90_g166, partial [Aureobasidium melanogenum]
LFKCSRILQGRVPTLKAAHTSVISAKIQTNSSRLEGLQGALKVLAKTSNVNNTKANTEGAMTDACSLKKIHNTPRHDESYSLWHTMRHCLDLDEILVLNYLCA